LGFVDKKEKRKVNDCTTCMVLRRLLKTKTIRGVSHWGLAIYIKKCILRQKKNYGNSNISPCKNIIFKKIL
jgi:hypothetical protein